MRPARSIKAAILALLVSGCLLAGCGGGNDSPSQTIGQLPAVTAPPLTAPAQPQESPAATDTRPDTTTVAPTGASAATNSRGQASRQGGSKPANETKALRQKQISCEKKVAQLAEQEQRQALADCLNPSPPAAEVPEATPQR